MGASDYTAFGSTQCVPSTNTDGRSGVGSFISVNRNTCVHFLTDHRVMQLEKWIEFCGRIHQPAQCRSQTLALLKHTQQKHVRLQQQARPHCVQPPNQPLPHLVQVGSGCSNQRSMLPLGSGGGPSSTKLARSGFIHPLRPVTPELEYIGSDSDSPEPRFRPRPPPKLPPKLPPPRAVRSVRSPRSSRTIMVRPSSSESWSEAIALRALLALEN